MRAGADQVQIIAVNLVDQQPVGLDVAIAVMVPLAAQRVILVPGQQGLAFDQQQDDLAQRRHILAVLVRALYIAPELGTADRGPQRSDPQILEVALQGPLIMMSQNRQEEKDRDRSKKDYMINLKSELEIRTLHEKIDHFIMEQQQELLDLQKDQIEMMNNILKKVEKNAAGNRRL